MKKLNIGFALTGSFCTIPKMLPVIETLSKKHEIYPAVSETVESIDTRFGKSSEILNKLKETSGREVISTITQAEVYGPLNILDIVVIAPATGNILGKLASGITDNAVTMFAKAHLRNNKPLLLGISTNDGLSRSAMAIAKLMNLKNIYFIPYSQDDHVKKPFSLISHSELIEDAINSAIEGRQLQPILAKT